MTSKVHVLWRRLARLFFLSASLLLFPSGASARQEEEAFVEYRFRQSVYKALEAVSTILETTRNPQLPDDPSNQNHTYDDKFALAEFLTNMALAAETNALQRLGLTDDLLLEECWHQVHNLQKSATLRFQAQDSCVFLLEKEVPVVVSESEVEEVEIAEDGGWVSSSGNEKTTSKRVKISKNLKEFHWNVGISYSLSIFFGTNDEDAIQILRSNSTRTVVTSSGMSHEKISPQELKPDPPFPEKTRHPFVDINLTWLLQQLSKSKQVQFSIDRFSDKAKETCKTPRRNKNVQEAIEFSTALINWVREIQNFFTVRVTALANDHSQPGENEVIRVLVGIKKTAKSLFHPTVPFLENSSVLPNVDFERLLDEQIRRIDSAIQDLAQQYPSETLLMSHAETQLYMMTCHLEQLVLQFYDSINYVEQMLRNQLVQAIGKEVTESDFHTFLSHYYRKLFDASYQPNLFSYAIRRPNHYPDGSISIETLANSNDNFGPARQQLPEPVETWTQAFTTGTGGATPTIKIPINAATSIEIAADRYLHGWMQYRFAGANNNHQFRLAARANQFSGFLLVVGTMAGPNVFKPQHAIIVQNKDQVLVPLLAEVLPSAKDFQDAILSLSPEQQEFAKAFRAMQLESSVFGVCVIQLKPQMEVLLGLPPDSLTKEIQLTQDLMSLFMEYQIPSDLLSADSDPAKTGNINATKALASVKRNVEAVMDVIEKAKDDQLREEQRKADMKESMYGRGRGPTASPTSSQPSASPLAGPSLSPSSTPRNNVRTLSARSVNVQEEGGTMQSRSSGKSADAELNMMLFSANAFAANAESEPSWKSRKKPQPPKQANQFETPSGSSSSTSSFAQDFTVIPKVLDSTIEQCDPDSSLRSTVLTAASTWERSRQANLLTPSKKESLLSEIIELEKKKAFDLLDALSRSGSLPIEGAELHVVVAVSHCFEDDIMSTIIQQNVNPLEKIEKSALILASTIHGQSTIDIIGDSEARERLGNLLPAAADTLENAEG